MPFHTYTPAEINSFGDVSYVADGWSQCSRMESRGCTQRHTILVGWGGSRKFRKPIKEAVVPTMWLAAKRAKRARKPVRTLSDRLAALPEIVRSACIEKTSPTCRRCGGYGLVYHDRAERDVKCRKCGGEGVTHSERIVAKSVSAAEKMLAQNATEQQAAAAALNNNPQPNRPAWDGTLTSTWLRAGYIDDEEAERIREKVRVRHEETDYDELLSLGCSKDEARANAS